VPLMTSPQEEPNPARHSHACTAIEQEFSKLPMVSKEMGKDHGDHNCTTSVTTGSDLIAARSE